MFRKFSLEALMAARKELDDVNISHIETMVRAAMPLLKEILDAEIAEMQGESRPTNNATPKVPAPGSDAKN